MSVVSRLECHVPVTAISDLHVSIVNPGSDNDSSRFRHHVAQSARESAVSQPYSSCWPDRGASLRFCIDKCRWQSIHSPRTVNSAVARTRAKSSRTEPCCSKAMFLSSSENPCQGICRQVSDALQAVMTSSAKPGIVLQPACPTGRETRGAAVNDKQANKQGVRRRTSARELSVLHGPARSLREEEERRGRQRSHLSSHVEFLLASALQQRSRASFLCQFPHRQLPARPLV